MQERGLVSPIMVIVVAITAIASLCGIFLQRGHSLQDPGFFIIALSAVLGLYGLVMGLLLTLVHLCSLKVSGFRTLPLVGNTYYELGDALVRAPQTVMYRRPKTLAGAT